MINRPYALLLVTVVTVADCLAFATAYHPIPTARSQDESEFAFETVGSLQGTYDAIARTEGEHLVLGGRGKVDVVDVDNPARPRVVGTHAAITGLVSSIAVNGGEAYLASTEGLLVLDIADPANPSPVGQFLSEPLRGVAVQGDLAVVVGYDRAYIVDISDPSNPRELSRFEASVAQPVLLGDIALLGGMRPVLSIMDIGDPERPSELGRWDPPPGGWGDGVVVDAGEGLAYVGRTVGYEWLIPTPGPTVTPGGPTCTPTCAATRPPDQGWLHTVGVSTPAAPREIGRAMVGYDECISSLAIDVDRGHAYVGVGTRYGRGRIVAVDVSRADRPNYLARIELTAADVTFQDGLLYVAAGDQGLHILRAAVSATLFLPSAMRHTDLLSTATPTLSPTTTDTPTATGTSTATITPWPSYFGLDGFVVEGIISGEGVPNVEIALRIDGAEHLPVLTDADGFYSTPILELRAADWVAVPNKVGFTFDPPSATGRHEGWPGEHIQRVDFVAFRETSTPGAP